jgi:hypothetical protein
MTANLPAERPRTPVAAGAAVAAIVPQDLDQAYRLSTALSASGMAPRGMDKPEQILVAIMAGAELGLAPFQALQSFAVVNGRPTIWGDGLMAVVRARGVRVKEWIEGEGEAMVAHCHVIRPDSGEEVERAYTVADAKKAGLWGKQGPWQQHPKRMLQMRARAFALRDGCADMLRGVQVREEVDDYQHARDVTPKASGLRERLNGPATDEGFSAHHAPPEPVEFAEHAEEIAEAEFSAPEPDASPEDSFPGDAPIDDEPTASLELADASFDPIEWAGFFMRGLAHLHTVPEVEDAWKRSKAAGYVVKLTARNRALAEQLVAAVNERVAELKAV